MDKVHKPITTQYYTALSKLVEFNILTSIIICQVIHKKPNTHPVSKGEARNNPVKIKQEEGPCCQ
jgi:hypothetical protein